MGINVRIGSFSSAGMSISKYGLVKFYKNELARQRDTKNNLIKTIKISMNNVFFLLLCLNLIAMKENHTNWK